MLWITGDRDALVIKDLFSGLKQLYPVKDKTADATEMSIRHLIGDRRALRLYSDRSGEIGKALKALKIMPYNSQPGVPQNNAVVERLNQDYLEGVRIVLGHAGLPACFWPFAA